MGSIDKIIGIPRPLQGQRQKSQSFDVGNNPFLDRAVLVLEADILALQDKRSQS
jgi:hypothetical protein